MDKKYDHKKYEEKIYADWEKSDAFKPSEKGEPFSIIMPPPNANGDLHMGHALMLTVEDIMTRYARQTGKSTLWYPGTDHAGFETQVVYEKVLQKQGRSRLQMSNDELYKEIWDFTQKNRKNMVTQIKQLGCSCDWSKEKFTLDKDIVETVYKTFAKLHQDNLIYRGVRLVNYSPKYRTSFSDLEIEHVQTKGKLTYILYPFVDGEINGERGIEVATTRPETMLGDTAVAVNDKDKRYKDFIGKKVKLPISGREIEIIADSEVDKQFGTGAVKVTPAHDFVDFEIGERHKLEMIQVIGLDGKLNENAPKELQKLKAATEGRAKVVEMLKKEKAFVKEVEHLHQVPMGYKGGAIEPLPLEQWFVKMDKFAKRVKDVIESGEVEVYPANNKKILYQWLDNIRDWNISRQIAWGIPIPVWYCKKCGEATISTKLKDSAGQQGVSMSDIEPPTKCAKCGHDQLTQEKDTFDTWFSSGQWVFATLGFDPETGQASDDFKKFMPTTVMETAADIIFFWVARMIFMTDYVTGKIPFKNVYLHGLVLDPKGAKMSKSKGNVLNPIDMVEKYGTDALRMSLVVGNVAGSNQPFSEDKVRAYRNFANKVWNMGRFIEFKLDGQSVAKKLAEVKEAPKAETDADKDILERLATMEKNYNSKMPKWKYWLVAEELYQFAWHEFADIYIEKSKDQKSVDNTNAILLYVYSRILHMLEPFMPFITTVIRHE